MDNIASFLKPHKDLIGNLTFYLAVAVSLSGIRICHRISKNGTKNISSLVFVTNVMMGLVRYKAGILLNDDVIQNMSSAAVILNTVWCGFYYFYANDKWNEIIKQFSICVIIAAVVWYYPDWADPSVAKFRFGLIISFLSLLLLISPVLATKNIIKNKDASQVSVLWSLLSASFAFSLCLYSTILGVKLLVMQSALVFLLTSLTVLLAFIYPGESQKSDKKKQ